MKMKKCIPCYGSGLIEGGGNVKINCKHCNGSGNIPDHRESIQKIKDLDPEMTQEDAEKLFAEEMEKLTHDGDETNVEAKGKEKTKAKR